MSLCQAPTQITTIGIGSEFNCTDSFRPAELFQVLAPCSSAHEYKAEAIVVAELPHGFRNCVFFVCQAESTRIMHYQRPILEWSGQNLAPVSPVFRHKNLVSGNPSG